METRKRRLPRAVGWGLAGFLGIVIVLETIALTVIAWFISTLLAVAVPLVVAATALVIAKDVRRQAARTRSGTPQAQPPSRAPSQDSS